MRDIDISYQQKMIANNTQDIKWLQTGLLATQLIAAQQMDGRLAEIGFGVDRMHYALNSIGRNVGDVDVGIQRLISTSNHIETGIFKVDDSLHNLTTLVDNWLSSLSDSLISQHNEMQSIAETLASPLETTARELRRKAEEALVNGMKSSEIEQKEWHIDALGLFQETVNNAVGNQDYVAWFQIGWLQWKANNDLEKAEAALRRAARLSKAKLDDYYAESVRHLAHILYLSGRYDEAYSTIKEILTMPEAEHLRKPEIIYDIARYLAILGKTESAICMLERCLKQEPTRVVAAISEPDFAVISQDVSNLIIRLTSEERVAATTAVNKWIKLVTEYVPIYNKEVHTAYDMVADEGETIYDDAEDDVPDLSELPYKMSLDHARYEAQQYASNIETASFAEAVVIKNRADDAWNELSDEVITNLEKVIQIASKRKKILQNKLKKIPELVRQRISEADKTRETTIKSVKNSNGSCVAGCTTILLIPFGLLWYYARIDLAIVWRIVTSLAWPCFGYICAWICDKEYKRAISKASLAAYAAYTMSKSSIENEANNETEHIEQYISIVEERLNTCYRLINSIKE